MEVHPDYKKVNGVRDTSNGANKEVLIHRLYGAINIGDKVYRVKVTLKEDNSQNNPQSVYSYEVTKIELLDVPMAANNIDSQQVGEVPSNSISATKLLKDVEKSYDKGKKLLDESENIRFRFIGEQGASNLDKAEEATTRLDNLSIAREMVVICLKFCIFVW